MRLEGSRTATWQQATSRSFESLDDHFAQDCTCGAVVWASFCASCSWHVCLWWVSSRPSRCVENMTILVVSLGGWCLTPMGTKVSDQTHSKKLAGRGKATFLDMEVIDGEVLVMIHHKSVPFICTIYNSLLFSVMTKLWGTQ